MNHRQQFIKSFFIFLKKERYALLKFTLPDTDSIGEFSDIDLAISRELKDKVVFFLEGYPNLKRFKTYSYSFMEMIYIQFHDGTFIELDLIHAFVRKEICYLDIREMLLGAQVFEGGIKIPEQRHNFNYIFLFYLLNNQGMDERYTKHFVELPSENQWKILNFINDRYGLAAKSISELCIYDEHTYRKVYRLIIKKNGFLFRFKRAIFYVCDVLLNLKKSRMITFSGVDGSGKTTILREVKDVLKNKYRRNVIELRHRPSLFPILSAIKYGKQDAENRSVERLPRTGSNQSGGGSLFRFSYYFLDYFLGQWLIFFKHSLRGDVILYDRYFFDFIVDGKRSNIKLNTRFVKFFYRFVFKAELNIFLYASPDVILNRKQELEPLAVIELTSQYKKLFSEFERSDPKHQYLCVENNDKIKTMRQVESACCDAF